MKKMKNKQRRTQINYTFRRDGSKKKKTRTTQTNNNNSNKKRKKKNNRNKNKMKKMQNKKRRRPTGRTTLDCLDPVLSFPISPYAALHIA